MLIVALKNYLHNISILVGVDSSKNTEITIEEKNRHVRYENTITLTVRLACEQVKHKARNRHESTLEP